MIRTDSTTPFIQLNTEGDIEELGAALVRQPDNNYLRTWELAGASHIDLHEGLYEGATIQHEVPQLTASSCVFGIPFNGGTLPDSMEGYYSPFSTSTLRGLYPAHSDYVSTFTSAAASDLASGFLTPADDNAAVAAAPASPVP